MKQTTITIFLFLLFTYSFAQEKKSVEAMHISKPLVIDGILDEEVYKNAKPAENFIQIQPYNGKPAMQPTEAYFFYDESAIYVGAMLHDKPDSIFKYMTQRDNTGMSDYFGVYIDPFNQGQIAYGFFLTPAGVQMDLKAIKSDGDNEDTSWNAVWESKTQITEKGWSLEMRIPFSELRFSEKSGSTWGLNMFRNIRRFSSNNSWNFLDRNVAGFIHQEGQLTGIKNVKPPVRLSLSPYLSTYFQPKSANNPASFLYKGGLDLKYGINESFTLDMMLIPDFGQIQSDDKKLNLTPFELYYSEKRQFFNEGTELFQRGNIFYSRRIGSAPRFSAYNSLKSNEIIDYSPSETQLVNATKVSGRTTDGWGIGVLNAMSLQSNATLRDTISGRTRDVSVQPFTNYNVLVVDKSLKNNSYISLINTNVAMFGNPFHANVTATEFQFRDKSKTYALKGKAGLSVRGDSTSETGFYTSLRFEKNKGKFLWGAAQTIYSDKYNPNDLGYLPYNNQSKTEAWIYYQITEPFWIFREINGDLWANYTRTYKPNTIFDKETGFDFFSRFKNNYLFMGDAKVTSDQFDYYEPRVTGRFYKKPHLFQFNVYVQTDNRKPLNFFLHYGHLEQSSIRQYANFGDINTTLRVGQRLEFNYSFSFNNSINENGFVDVNLSNDSIVFAKRNVYSLENIFSTSYILSNKASVTLRARHYWSGAANKKFYLLEQNGSLIDNQSYQQNMDQNYNAFTIDMDFRWNFAPGSELVCAWKSASMANQNRFNDNYIKNLNNTWLGQTSSLSVKVLYYIDFNSFKKKKS